MFDPYHFLDAILEAAREGVDATMRDVANRARERAPVRKLFRGGRRVAIKGKIETRGAIGYESVFTTNSPSHFRYRVGRVAQLSRQNTPILTTGKRQGRPNSGHPVTRVLPGLGIRVIGGDISFREVSGGQFVHQALLARINGKSMRIDLSGEYLQSAIKDVKRGRGLRKTAGGGEEYGGTLRESIQVIPAVRSRYEVIGYVEAHATDPGRDFDYARAQEFGTAHNRAQPFLRPSLREMAVRLNKRKLLKNTSFYQHMRSGPKRPSRPVIGSEIALTVGHRQIDEAVKRTNARLDNSVKRLSVERRA